jgi:hypothetical protein
MDVNVPSCLGSSLRLASFGDLFDLTKNGELVQMIGGRVVIAEEPAFPDTPVCSPEFLLDGPGQEIFMIRDVNDAIIGGQDILGKLCGGIIGD